MTTPRAAARTRAFRNTTANESPPPVWVANARNTVRNGSAIPSFSPLSTFSP
jgi:hypothetical protein